jgi:succinate dehydrogenase/fumarate reductase flavoprotein subunit
MNQDVGIVRSATNLQKGLEKILTLKDKFHSQIRVLPKNGLNNENNIKNLIITLEVRSSLVVCEAIIMSAFMRKESMGARSKGNSEGSNKRTFKTHS